MRKTNPELAQMLELEDKYIKKYYNCIPYIQKQKHERHEKNLNYNFKDEIYSKLKNSLDGINRRLTLQQNRWENPKIRQL